MLGTLCTNDILVMLEVLTYNIFSSIDIESLIDRFERKFRTLLVVAYRELVLRHNLVEMVKDDLSVMPNEIMNEHHKYVVTISKKVNPFTNLTLFLNYLNLNCWNCFEYKLLKHLIDNNCSADLKAEMLSYAHDMQTFQQQTTMFNFIKCSNHQMVLKMTSVPPCFRRFIIEYGINLDSYTLADVESFRVDTCSHLKLSECALQIYSIKHNCTIVEWIFPEEITEVLSCFYSDENGQELLQSHHVKRVSIDEKSLHSVSTHHNIPFVVKVIKAILTFIPTLGGGCANSAIK